MTTPAQWVAGARPRTLPAAVVPVAVGSAIAYFNGFSVNGFAAGIRIFLALVVALALQVGVNYSNDYPTVFGEPTRSGLARFDSLGRACRPIRGEEGGTAVVPRRMCVWRNPGSAHASLVVVDRRCVCRCCRVVLHRRTSPLRLRGTRRGLRLRVLRLGRRGGTTFVLTGQIQLLAVILAIPVGLFACALLVINNLRDIPGDTKVGKNTLAV